MKHKLSYKVLPVAWLSMRFFPGWETQAPVPGPGRSATCVDRQAGVLRQSLSHPNVLSELQNFRLYLAMKTRGQQTFSIKAQSVNIFASAGHLVSVETPLCCYSASKHP